MRYSILYFIGIFTIWGCAGSKSQMQAMQNEVERLQSDSLSLEKRIEKLKEENTYLSEKCASIEQAYTQRLIEMEDSLNLQYGLISAKESQLTDIQIRNRQKNEAFTELSVGIAKSFEALNLPAESLKVYTGCSFIVAELSNHLMFVSGTSKPENTQAQVLKQVSDILLKNHDLIVQVIAMSDTLIHIREKINDPWQWNAHLSGTISKSLIREYKVPSYKISSSAQVVGIKPEASHLPTNNKIRFIFQSLLLPCAH